MIIRLIAAVLLGASLTGCELLLDPTQRYNQPTGSSSSASTVSGTLSSTLASATSVTAGSAGSSGRSSSAGLSSGSAGSSGPSSNSSAVSSAASSSTGTTATGSTSTGTTASIGTSSGAGASSSSGTPVVTDIAGNGFAAYADGPAGHVVASELDDPIGLAVDAAGNVYVGDFGSNRIRRLDVFGHLTTLAGNGVSSFADGSGGPTGTASFKGPAGLAVDAAGSVYVADYDNNRIRVIDAQGNVTTLAGNGTAGDVDGTGGATGTAEFSGPIAVAVDSAGEVYVADAKNNRIRKIDSLGNVTTLAGNGTPGFADGSGGATGSAELNGPEGIALDGAGNVYVGDTGNNRIRRIDSSGNVTTLAGGASGFVDGTGGTAGTARFKGPQGLAIDAAGNLDVADTGNDALRQIAGSGSVTTLAGNGTAGFVDGTGASTGTARFNQPRGVAVDGIGNVYVADESNDRIRKFDTTGNVTTYAGSGTPGYADGVSTALAVAELAAPTGVAADGLGNIYVADSTNNRIRKIASTGEVTTFAGSGDAGFADGTGALAEFHFPTSVAVDSSGTVYVADTGNNRIRKIDSSGTVTTLAGKAGPDGGGGFADGPGGTAEFDGPFGVAVDGSGNVYVGDYNNERIRKIEPGGSVSTLAGSGALGWVDGAGPTAAFAGPYEVAVDSANNVYVADFGNNRIRKVTELGVVSTLAGRGTAGFADGSGGPDGGAEFHSPAGVAVDASGNVYVGDCGNNRIRMISAVSGSVTTLAGNGALAFADGTGGSAGTAAFDDPIGVATDALGNLYVGDTGNDRVRLIAASGDVTTLAGNGSAGFVDDTAELNGPFDVALDSAGNLYVGDTGNNRIRKVDLAGLVTTLAGGNGYPDGGLFADGPGATALFNVPRAVSLDSDGNVYVADFGNNRVRKVDPGGTVTTFAGNGTAGFRDGPPASDGGGPEFNGPSSVAVDSAGNVYVADFGNNRIRLIDSSGNVSTLAGNGGFPDGGGLFADGSGGPTGTAEFNGPHGLAVDGAGNVYVADYYNNRIRKITGGTVTTIAGTGIGGYLDGPASNAEFRGPRGVAIDGLGNLYVADTSNDRIRLIANSTVSTLAGNGLPGFVNGAGGPTGVAELNMPRGVAVDGVGNVYVADTANNCLRRITP